ncbi:MAG: KH domain-containing protein [Erysipelotrichaceae bacterium]|nr:KH domain-containing protein [Erysipelotrichaceae bacterium]
MKRRVEGKTLEDVLNSYAQEKGIEVADITYQVVEEKKGILGIGSKVVAEVYCNQDIAEFLENYLRTYFEGLHLDVEIEVEQNNDSFKVMLNAENNAILIGKNGQTLQALNTVVRSAVSSTFKKRVHVLIDINNYKQDRYAKVKMMAKRIAKTVQRTKVSAVLDPMPNDERKVVHQYLTDMEHIRTESEGEGKDRRLHIIYVD